MAFLIGAMSIAGFPPMGGFVAKFALFQETVLEQFYLPLLIAVVCAVITIFYMFKTWIAVFWGENRGSLEESSHHKISPEIIIPIVMLCVLVILLGVYPEPLYNVSNQIAAQILDPTVYISAVLEGVAR
jgi:multicomponent Na+:H+ antiporter subunit D